MKAKPLKWLFLKGFFSLFLGLVLWVFLFEPPYSKLLVSASQSLVATVEKDESTSVRLQGTNIIYIPIGLVSKGQKAIQAMRDVRELDYNSVILFALVLFSPGLALVKRVWVFMAGFALLFLTQLVNILIQVKFLYALQLGEYSRLHYGTWERNIYAFLKQFFELIGRFAFPFAIWMFFTYKETVGYLVKAEPGIEPRRRKKK